VSKLTTDVVTYCTEASNQKSKYAYQKIVFYKKSTACNYNKIYHITQFMCAPYRVVRTEPVCCEPSHRRVEASSVSLCRRWRRTFWTLRM